MNRQTFGQRVKQLLAPVLAALATAGKWVPVLLKFGFPMLKMSAGLLISLWFYARFFGWQFAVGFLLLLFIHEMGHLIAARMVGLKVSLPVFIPFMGAVILLKDMPPNAWIEAIVGIGGPLLGSAGALAVTGCYYFTGNHLFLALGYTGFFLNLFNLVPIIPLDGGRIVSAISPWLWVVGLVIIVPYLILRSSVGGFLNSGISFVILLIVLSSFRRVLAVFRNRRSPGMMRYYECTPAQRWTMALLYFSLLGSLYVGMEYIKTIMPRGAL
jgi:Zn-dependent protease